MAPFNTEAILAEHGDNNDNQGQCCESPKASVSQMALDRIRVQGHSAKLDLSMSNLTFVPVEEIKEHYGNPVTLDLSHNHISCLCPKFVSEWKEHLTRLDVSNNRITMLPDDLGSLSQLTYLDIHRNMLTTLPLSMNKLTKLYYLNLSDNPFKEPLADYLELEVVNADVNLAKAVVDFLARIEEENTSEAFPDCGLISRKRSVSFVSVQAARDRAKLDVIFPMEIEDEENRNELKSRRRTPRSRALTNSMEELIASESASQLKSRRVKEPRHEEIMKGVGLFLLLLLVIPFVIWTMVDAAYFDEVAKKYPGFNPFWIKYKPINYAVTTILGCKCNMDFPLIINGPPEQVGLIRFILRAIASMFYYVTRRSH